MSGLHIFPIELYIDILKDVDGVTLVRCQRVCRLWRLIIQETTELQYNIEFAISGLEGRVSVPHKASFLERTELLRHHEAAWRNLEYSAVKSAFIPAGAVIRFVPDAVVHDGKLALLGINSQLLFVLPLESPVLEIPEEPDWGIRIVARRAEAFCICPALGLLVLLEDLSFTPIPTGIDLRLHILSFKSAHPHPNADPGFIDFQSDYVPHPLSHTIKANGDHVAMLVQDNDNRHAVLGIWDWRTSERRMELTGEGIQSFAFLTEKHVIVLVHKSWLPTERSYPKLFVLDITTVGPNITSCDEVAYSLAFRFPVPSSQVKLRRIDMWTDHHALSSSIKPQDQPAADSIVLFRLRGADPGTSPDDLGTKLLEIFVPASTLLRHLRRECGGGVLRRVLNYREWLSTDARVQHSLYDDLANPRNSISGYRYAQSIKPEAGEPDRLVIRVMDFSVPRIQHAMESGKTDVEISYPDDVPKGFWDDEGISSSASCLVSKAEITSTENEQLVHSPLTMISDSAIVVVNGLGGEAPRMHRILF